MVSSSGLPEADKLENAAALSQYKYNALAAILTPSQSAALQYIEDYARRTPTVGQAELENVLTMSNIELLEFEGAVRQVKENARVCLQFHPDRPAGTAKSVIQVLLEEGQYRNQFDTRLSNGRLDPFAEGQRAKWEDRIFGGVFAKHGATLSERPKYGALNLMRHPDGPSPRFGSCYFILKPELSARCTFSYMDSHREPAERGTLRKFGPIIAALMTECFERRFALGVHNISPPELVRRLATQLREPFENPAGRPAGRNLTHYIEAQVHGEISLMTDVDILVADPSFKDSLIEDYFERLSESYNIEVLWHCGFNLASSEVPDDFRGPGMPSLAERVAEGDPVNALRIGIAARDLQQHPEKWSDRGSPALVLQELKCLWHVVVQFGEPAA